MLLFRARLQQYLVLLRAEKHEVIEVVRIVIVDGDQRSTVTG